MARNSNRWIFDTHEDSVQRLATFLSPRRRKKVRKAREIESYHYRRGSTEQYEISRQKLVEARENGADTP